MSQAVESDWWQTLPPNVQPIALEVSMPQRRPVFSIPLVRELTLVLIIKLVLITLIARAFFSDPVETDPQGTHMDEVFGIPSASPSLSQETQHDQ